MTSLRMILTKQEKQLIISTIGIVLESGIKIKKIVRRVAMKLNGMIGFLF